MNLDDFNVSPQHAPFMINFSNIATTSHVFVPPHATLITTTNPLGSTSIKCKHTNAFSLMIETTNKNNKQIIEVMDRINLISKFKSITRQSKWIK